MDEKESLLLEHLLNIVELITQELKDVKKEISVNDKDIALINLRLHAAEKLVKEIKAHQDSSKVINAEDKGANTVKWAIVALVGTSALVLVIKEAFEYILPTG